MRVSSKINSVWGDGTVPLRHTIEVVKSHLDLMSYGLCRWRWANTRQPCGPGIDGRQLLLPLARFKVWILFTTVG